MFLDPWVLPRQQSARSHDPYRFSMAFEESRSETLTGNQNKNSSELLWRLLDAHPRPVSHSVRFRISMLWEEWTWSVCFRRDQCRVLSWWLRPGHTTERQGLHLAQQRLQEDPTPVLCSFASRLDVDVLERPPVT